MSKVMKSLDPLKQVENLKDLFIFGVWLSNNSRVFSMGDSSQLLKTRVEMRSLKL
jgi:hypothetical protein